MKKYIVGIKGMRCGMCEMHIEDAIRKNIKAKKIKASHIKNELIVITDDSLLIDDFHRWIDDTGYEIISFEKVDAKKTFFGWH